MADEYWANGIRSDLERNLSITVLFTFQVTSFTPAYLKLNKTKRIPKKVFNENRAIWFRNEKALIIANSSCHRDMLAVMKNDSWSMLNIRDARSCTQKTGKELNSQGFIAQIVPIKHWICLSNERHTFKGFTSLFRLRIEHSFLNCHQSQRSDPDWKPRKARCRQSKSSLASKFKCY